MAVVHGFVHSTTFLEKYILGLTYEIRGLEHIPEDGAYIVAAKHQSAYETFKLHILFNDPAVVLKQELLKIPFWGAYLGKSDPIAINRSSPKEAIKSLQEEGIRVAKQNRPLVIFPQGTRVSTATTAQKKPYKIGLIRLQEATELSIIPMALNSGHFYPKHKWLKKPGVVIFEFLKPIPYIENKAPQETLNQIEMRVEEKASHLLDEVLNKPKPSQIKFYVLIFALLVSIAYTANWFIVSDIAATKINKILIEIKENPGIKSHQIDTAEIYGFPFKMTMRLNNQSLSSTTDTIHIKEILATSWPFIGMPLDITIKKISQSNMLWAHALEIDNVNMHLFYGKNILNINKFDIESDQTQLKTFGTIDFNIKPRPQINMDIELHNSKSFIQKVGAAKVLKPRKLMIMGVSLGAMEQNGVIKTRLHNDGNSIYLGLIKVFELPPVK